ncbi:hypothetical protein Tco_0785263 [Tanacetum coccineum]
MRSGGSERSERRRSGDRDFKGVSYSERAELLSEYLRYVYGLSRTSLDVFLLHSLALRTSAYLHLGRSLIDSRLEWLRALSSIGELERTMLQLGDRGESSMMFYQITYSTRSVSALRHLKLWRTVRSWNDEHWSSLQFLGIEKTKLKQSLTSDGEACLALTSPLPNR